MKVYSGKELIAVGVAIVMVLSMALSVVPGALSVHAAATDNSPTANLPSSPSAAVTSSALAPAASGHTQGTMNIYEVAAAGANTLDPAVAYDTVSYEPILNVYETLINYNGNSTSTFVPTVATCVPGTAQCTADYGQSLIQNNATGAPTYWTFVIDPAAHFYDPATTRSWSVYPSDVMFSLARTMGFADLPYVGKENGWIIAQSLLPYGNASWSSLHVPYNNTPADILGSMYINDSAYCPAAALTNAHGCITFNASGGGQDWPYFLQLVADNLGASIVPCGWFTAQGAGIPGWAGSKAVAGDGPCAVPQLGVAQSTTSTAWTDYLTNLTNTTANMTSWDAFEELSSLYPANQPGVQWNMAGSGPYYAGVVEGIGYDLRVNPGYVQPSGCSGVGGLATYGGYCDPAVHGYTPNVNVYWEPNDQFGISEYRAGAADLAAIESVHTTTLLQLHAAGDLNYFSFPTISSFFTPVNLYWSSSEYAQNFGSEPVPNIPADFFTNLALREFYVHAYPYTTVENTINTVDGVQYTFNAGGPIPYGMGNYYPTNVSFPSGDPITDPSVVGGAAWWWAQANNATSAYYDPQLAACSSGHPCTFPIAGLDGDPAGDQSIADWISEIELLTGGALQPFGGDTFDLTFDQFLNVAFTSAYQNPLVSETGSGWAPDYPDPTDYIAPMSSPDATYTAADAVAQQLQYGKETTANNTTCGNSSSSFQNLSYWSSTAQTANLTGGALNSTCQGVAYSVAVGQMAVAAGLPVGTQRTLDYNLIEQILNDLAMYVWNGQSNEVLSAAPWIDLSTLNQNPMIGGGGDQIWFQVHYAYTSTVTFQESGLHAGTSWSVTLGSTTESSTTSTIAFAGIGNGTYAYSTLFTAGYGATPANGTLDITGPVTQDVAFTPFSGSTYAVTFQETGLVSNLTWSIILTGVGTVSTNDPNISVVLPNAAYDYAPSVVPGFSNSSGASFTVASVAQQVNVTYTSTTLPVYWVNFTASGLTAGKTWSVTLTTASSGKFTLSSDAATISFEENAGTIQAAYGSPKGFVASPSSSEVIVAGTTETLVPFLTTYAVTFTETGLPVGAMWTVYFGGVSASNTTTTVSFAAPDGTWSFGIVGPAGYTADQVGGSLTVSGAATGHAATFSSTVKAASPSSSYLSSLAKELIVALAVLAVIGFALAGWAASRGPPSSPPPKGWSADEKAGKDPAKGSSDSTDSEFESEDQTKS
ncbi:MAG: hypothetical protein WAK40_04125 [Thermoplasmata archaeon]